jgi:hypothetical protein
LLRGESQKIKVKITAGDARNAENRLAAVKDKPDCPLDEFVGPRRAVAVCFPALSVTIF